MKNLFLAILVFNFTICAEDQNASINSLLDGLHEDAHEGNFKDYFARYAKNAFFLGTDKTERWTIEEFKAYAKPAFNDGHGWTCLLYTSPSPRDRTRSRMPSSA